MREHFRLLALADQDRAGQSERDLIKNVISRHVSRVRTCYLARLPKKPGLEGQIVVGFDVLPTGTVKNARIRSATLADEKLERCVLKVISSIKFSKGPETRQVSYPLTFQSGTKQSAQVLL